MPTALANQLREIARREGATLYMILMAAYEVLLYRYSGQKDFAVGSPIAGRLARETEALVGCFVNTLVIRVSLDDHDTFRQVLGRVPHDRPGSIPASGTPVRAARGSIQPDPRRKPSSGVSGHVHAPKRTMAQLKIADINIAAIPLDTGTSKFDLSFIAHEQADGLSVAAEFGSPLFERATVARCSRHYQLLLEGIVAGLYRPISQLPLLDDAEHHQIVVEWNDPRGESPTECVHQMIVAQAKRNPDAVAVEFEGNRLSYRELDERANQLTHLSREIGVGPETLVGISVERSLEMVIGLLGIWKAGGAYVPLDPAFPRERRAFMLDDADVPVLLTQSRLARELLECRAHVVCLDTEWSEIGAHSPDAPTNRSTPENLAYVLYTSGSTGKPKGVQISHRTWRIS